MSSSAAITAAFSIIPDTESKLSKRNHISTGIQLTLNESMNGSIYNQKPKPDIPFSFSFPSTLPNGTFARLNKGILNVNLLLEDGFNPVVVVCPSGELSSGTNITVCWSCAAGGAVGSDATRSSTEDDGVLLSELEAVYTCGRSVISGVGDGSWRSTDSRLRRYVRGGIEGMVISVASFGGEMGESPIV